MFNALTRLAVQAGVDWEPLWYSLRYIDWMQSPEVYVAKRGPLREQVELVRRGSEDDRGEAAINEAYGKVEGHVRVLR